MTKLNTIRREGGSRVLAVSRVIPAGWEAVELIVIKSTKDCITLKVERVK